MTLVRADEADRAVMVLVVVPGHEPEDPIACRFDSLEAVDRKIVPVLQCPEQRLGVSIVIADPRTAERTP